MLLVNRIFLLCVISTINPLQLSNYTKFMKKLFKDIYH